MEEIPYLALSLQLVVAAVDEMPVMFLTQQVEMGVLVEAGQEDCLLAPVVLATRLALHHHKVQMAEMVKALVHIKEAAVAALLVLELRAQDHLEAGTAVLELPHLYQALQ